ncbi:MAG TPA: hypothetical protein VFQ57_05495 [Sphingomonas sp.]|nr:hypothetical protein [Sphingomonas sp.]
MDESIKKMFPERGPDWEPDLTAHPVPEWKLPDDYKNSDEIPPMNADDGIADIWGNIEVQGKVVAQIFKSGGISTSSRYLLPDKAMAVDDPAERARMMIEAYGGNLVRRAEMAKPTLWVG